ncbi:MAG TPA: hypothetical protein VM186_03090 [Planctomycetota bacterium]|nr:hypothetical protein [Planctomycetota bacterium]
MTSDRTDLQAASPKPQAPSRSRRPFVGLLFECCGVYGRLYPNRARTAFEGRCPHCYRVVSIPTGQDGTDARFFRG